MLPKRTRELTIRLTDEELASIRMAAADRGVGMADLARSLLAEVCAVPVKATRRRRSVAPTHRPAPVADPALVREVAKIGNNLNQVARWANTYKTAAEAFQILAAMTAIEREVTDVLSSYCPRPPDSAAKEGEDAH